MDVDFDFSDVDSFFDEGVWEVEKKMIDVGDEAVKYAEENEMCIRDRSMASTLIPGLKKS